MNVWTGDRYDTISLNLSSVQPLQRKSGKVPLATAILNRNPANSF